MDSRKAACWVIVRLTRWHSLCTAVISLITRYVNNGAWGFKEKKFHSMCLENQHVCVPTSPGRTLWWGAAQRWAWAEWHVWRPSPWWPGETLCTHFTSSTASFLILSVIRSGGRQFYRSRAWNKNVSKTTTLPVWEDLATTRARLLTCLAAILEDPTTFPLSSNTSMPSDSSVCLIKPTLQMFAVALRTKTRNSYNFIHLHGKKEEKICHWRLECISRQLRGRLHEDRFFSVCTVSVKTVALRKRKAKLTHYRCIFRETLGVHGPFFARS